MRIEDILWLSYKDLNEKRVRTLLTMLMVAIGVASIIALTSLTAGVSQSVQNSLNTLGPTSIIVSPATSTGFTVTDVAKLSALPNESAVIPVITGSVYVLANGQNTSATIVGVSSEGLRQLLGGNVSLYQGAQYSDTISPASVVGHSLAFPSSLAGQQNLQVGSPITLKIVAKNGITSTVPVIGILQSYGSLIVPVDTGVMMSLQAAQTLLHRNYYNLILVKATNTSTVAPLASMITDIYGNSARVTTTQQILQTVNQIIGGITLLLVIIGGVSLLVAAIGIMNIMLIAVYERTHEIGIMKSLGFENRHILLVFLTQALIIGALGGAVGVGAGIGASYVLTSLTSSASSSSQTTQSAPSASSGRGGGGFSGGGGGNAVFIGSSTSSSSSSSGFSYKPVFTPVAIAESIMVAIIVSIIAGMYPAWRASKMEPIDALRQL